MTMPRRQLLDVAGYGGRTSSLSMLAHGMIASRPGPVAGLRFSIAAENL